METINASSKTNNSYTELISEVIKKSKNNLSSPQLKQEILEQKRGEESELGALVISTGKFTGRSPKDKFFVKESSTAHTIDWNDFNLAFEPHFYFALKADLLSYLNAKPFTYTQNVKVGADAIHNLTVQIITEHPEASLFVKNMFIPNDSPNAEWTLLQAPGFKANPEVHGTRSENFAIISFEDKTVIIGGTGYTGEIKKGMFTVANYLYPIEKDFLSMHCSANADKKGNVALFFGLSGTGKTTLSADPDRQLIGDDEHIWSKEGVFNLEGGCYAKIINLSPENEPQIFKAIRENALVENTSFIPNTKKIDFACQKITENTRVSYPLDYIDDALLPSVGAHPKHIFFLTCDAFGVLPPISVLTPEQICFYFLSGYTAKIAGTEEGIKEPVPTFSTCFGAPFLPLAPAKYATMLMQKVKENEASVWMINTGWIGGGYGEGHRISLKYTRAMIKAVLNNSLKEVITKREAVFGLHVPLSCPGVPSCILQPMNNWADKSKYQQARIELASKFLQNFKRFEETVDKSIIEALPKI